MGRTAWQQSEQRNWLRREAEALGFSAIGFAKAGLLDEEADRFESWLKSGYAGEMGYLERNIDKRLDPRLLVPGTRTVVSLLFNYHNPEAPSDPDAPRIASYALGEDYHHVVKWKLKELLKRFQQEWGAVEGRVFIDSAPVMERQWAQKSGLGWTGKNSLLLNKRMGSYFFIGELLLDIELEPDAPATDHCGTCRRCLDACPTGAIIQAGVVDGSKCISYFTIELRGEIPEPAPAGHGNWVFGCDICQEVCPWNRHATPHQEPRFDPSPDLLQWGWKEWEELTRESFKEHFKGTPLERTGWAGMMRNLKWIADA